MRFQNSSGGRKKIGGGGGDGPTATRSSTKGGESDTERGFRRFGEARKKPVVFHSNMGWQTRCLSKAWAGRFAFGRFRLYSLELGDPVCAK